MTTLVLFDDRVDALLAVVNAMILAVCLLGGAATLAVLGVRRLTAARAAAKCIGEIEAFLRGPLPPGGRTT
jgi:Flp pilus assembly protein protease CpaA